jgi:hypothetical protein
MNRQKLTRFLVGLMLAAALVTPAVPVFQTIASFYSTQPTQATVEQLPSGVISADPPTGSGGGTGG